MNFINYMWEAIKGTGSRQQYELMQFVKSEFRDDWQWAYQNIKTLRKVPYAK